MKLVPRSEIKNDPRYIYEEYGYVPHMCPEVLYTEKIDYDFLDRSRKREKEIYEKLNYTTPVQKHVDTSVWVTPEPKRAPKVQPVKYNLNAPKQSEPKKELNVDWKKFYESAAAAEKLPKEHYTVTIDNDEKIVLVEKGSISKTFSYKRKHLNNAQAVGNNLFLMESDDMSSAFKSVFNIQTGELITEQEYAYEEFRVGNPDKAGQGGPGSSASADRGRETTSSGPTPYVPPLSGNFLYYSAMSPSRNN
tara:strand:+ start:648 stop:1394 length:747 start_codon:yes stop_codon:yes gene_type:complete